MVVSRRSVNLTTFFPRRYLRRLYTKRLTVLRLQLMSALLASADGGEWPQKAVKGHPLRKYGAGRVRTYDPWIRNQTHYLLRYGDTLLFLFIRNLTLIGSEGLRDRKQNHVVCLLMVYGGPEPWFINHTGQKIYLDK